EHAEDKGDGDVQMRVSSHRQGTSSRDTALGSRVRESGGVGKPRTKHVVGEQSMQFVPEKKKKKDAPEAEETQELPTRKKERADPRRSASGNAFRGL
ncbi:hypothetical protein IMZ48_46240, partial [Candidatus Bathyarchaeota archaeon]|nr:hypothetical protein [Candidatus Bathyarchaeota archaeon]